MLHRPFTCLASSLAPSLAPSTPNFSGSSEELVGNFRERAPARERERTRTVHDHYRDLFSESGSILRGNGALVANSSGERSLASIIRLSREAPRE